MAYESSFVRVAARDIPGVVSTLVGLGKTIVWVEYKAQGYLITYTDGIIPPPSSGFLLLETGDFLLLETGDKIILE